MPWWTCRILWLVNQSALSSENNLGSDLMQALVVKICVSSLKYLPARQSTQQKFSSVKTGQYQHTRSLVFGKDPPKQGTHVALKGSFWSTSDHRLSTYAPCSIYEYLQFTTHLVRTNTVGQNGESLLLVTIMRKPGSHSLNPQRDAWD